MNSSRMNIHGQNKEEKQLASTSSGTITSTQEDSESQNVSAFSAFGLVQHHIEGSLPNDVVQKLSLLLPKFNAAQRSTLEVDKNPSRLFVQHSVKMGYITPSGASPVIKALEVMKMNGPAEEIRKIYEDYQESLEAQLSCAESDEITKQSLVITQTATSSKRKSAPEESGNIKAPTNQMHKRKSVNKLKSSNPGESDQHECFIYIHTLRKDYRHLCKQDNATLIGAASEVTENSLETPKKIFMIRRDDGMCLSDKSFYLLENHVPQAITEGDCLIIGPHTKLSIVSRVKFRGVKLNKYDVAIESFWSSPASKTAPIEIPTVPLHIVKYHFPPKHTVLRIKGVIKEISRRGHEDNATLRRVVTLIDQNNHDFLSVVLHDKNSSSNHELVINNIVELRYFETARTKESSTNSNFLTSTRNSFIKEIEDEELNHLKTFQLVRGRGTPINGRVTKVGEVSKYLACPRSGCFLKEVTDHGGEYCCPKCQNTTREPRHAYLIKLSIDSNDHHEYKGVIFTVQIDGLKEQLRCGDWNTEDYLKSLPDRLLDWEVDAMYAENNIEGLNNVFKAFKLLRKLG